jgi:hypothetical protein
MSNKLLDSAERRKEWLETPSRPTSVAANSRASIKALLLKQAPLNLPWNTKSPG